MHFFFNTVWEQSYIYLLKKIKQTNVCSVYHEYHQKAHTWILIFIENKLGVFDKYVQNNLKKEKWLCGGRGLCVRVTASAVTLEMSLSVFF